MNRKKLQSGKTSCNFAKASFTIFTIPPASGYNNIMSVYVLSQLFVISFLSLSSGMYILPTQTLIVIRINLPQWQDHGDNRDRRLARRPLKRRICANVKGKVHYTVCMRLAGIMSLGVKTYRKETGIYTRGIFMGMNPVRVAKRETEGGDRYEQAAGGSGLGRSTNHRTIRPTSPPPQRSRSTLLRTVCIQG